MVDDLTAMRRALRLAMLGRHASPNPMVGCVLVSPDGRVVGSGFHERAGEPHAEANALRQAGDAARGATAYVTLEPCSHHGRTPPCADALTAAGVARVVIAVRDPDRRVSGTGIARLRDAGIAVDVGLCDEGARALNAAYFKHRETGLPYAVVKIAMSLDGKLAAADGSSRWITSLPTRRWAHRRFRDRFDAILVGVGTVRTDNPSLTTRLDHRVGRNPLRIVVDSHLRTRLTARVVELAATDGKTLIACLDAAAPDRRKALQDRGVESIAVPATADGRVDLRELWVILGSRDVTSILIEGGGQIIGSVLEAGLADRYVATIGPILLGGLGRGALDGAVNLAPSMAKAVRLSDVRVRGSGPDTVIDGTIVR